MIKVQIVRDKEGFIKKFTVKGHAKYAEHGADVVCAAVSAVAYTAVGSLEELAGVGGFSEKDGYMKCELPSGISEEARQIAGIILESMAIGFKQIEYSYSKYILVLDEEV